MQRIIFLFVLFFLATPVRDLRSAQLFHRKINQWKNNKYDGLWISWSDSLGRQVGSKGRFKEGKEVGVWKYYFDDGTLRRIERYSRKGIATKYYYPNGHLKSKGKAIVAYEEELLHYYYQGEWLYYDEEGKITQRITYDHGDVVSSVKPGEKKNK